jgi:hypothetical protein
MNKEKDIILHYIIKYWSISITILTLPFILTLSTVIKIYLIGILINILISNIYFTKNKFFKNDNIKDRIEYIFIFLILISSSFLSLMIGIISWFDDNN